ncbi:hypothetical protein HZC07_05300 [Candidatus Micrarchaeota archaeon]|nr:hypothetical protein [Candidatus Micrarchaeota archaeon]
MFLFIAPLVSPPPPPPSGSCKTVSDCSSGQYCSSGVCVSIPACGQLVNNNFVPYQCGSDPSCPVCSSGRVCENNRCVSSSLNAPTTGFVGDRIIVKGASDGAPCANCDVLVTDPLGKSSSLKTDSKGEVVLPLNLKGSYSISLLKNGTPVSSVKVDSLTKPTPGGLDFISVILSQAGPLVWGLVLLIIAVILFIYLRIRGQKTKFNSKK